MRRLAPFHGLTLIFLFGLILLTLLFREKIPEWYSLVFRYLLGIGIVLGLQLSFNRKRLGGLGTFLYYFSPIFFIVFIYQSFGDLIHHLWSDIDPWLIRIDFFIFGIHPIVWMERWITPWLTDLMSFFLWKFTIFLPFIFILTLYIQDKKREFKPFDIYFNLWLLSLFSLVTSFSLR